MEVPERFVRVVLCCWFYDKVFKFLTIPSKYVIPMHRLSMKMNLTEVLTQAEELFYKYCRQNITRGFAEIDL